MQLHSRITSKEILSYAYIVLRVRGRSCYIGTAVVMCPHGTRMARVTLKGIKVLLSPRTFIFLNSIYAHQPMRSPYFRTSIPLTFQYIVSLHVSTTYTVFIKSIESIIDQYSYRTVILALSVSLSLSKCLYLLFDRILHRSLYRLRISYPYLCAFRSWKAT